MGKCKSKSCCFIAKAPAVGFPIIPPVCNISAIIPTNAPTGIPILNNTTYTISSFSVTGNGLYNDGSLNIFNGIWTVPFTGIYSISAEIVGNFSSVPLGNMMLSLVSAPTPPSIISVIYNQTPFSPSVTSTTGLLSASAKFSINLLLSANHCRFY